MFTVIYTFQVKDNLQDQFIKSWSDLTDLIYEFEGSLGSRLHQIDGHNFVAYAQWPDKAKWDNSGDNLPKEANEIKRLMKESCDFIKTNFEASLIADKLKHKPHSYSNTKPRVTGIGGVFFKAKDTKSLKAWYKENLGLATDEYGSSFESRDANNPSKINYLQWSLFKNDTDYFEPSTNDHMINYRVNDLEALVEDLKDKNVAFCDSLEVFDYGKFIHLLDLEGNKIELWEPVDSVFTDMLNDNTTK